MIRLFAKLLRTLCSAVIIILLLSQIWQIPARLLLHQKLPFFLGFAQLDVLSGSMEPAFSTGDRLIIRREENYGTGDIITFNEEGAFVTHRIVGDSGSGFVTKGDANPVEDINPVCPEAIEGRVIFVIPSGGNPAVLLSLLAALAAVSAGLCCIGGNRLNTGKEKVKVKGKGGDMDA